MNVVNLDQIAWPGGARAAASLSYDDGNWNNLDIAIPDLEESGFRGTFYLTTGGQKTRQRAGDWREAFCRGHEIGNHSVHHPGRSEAYPSNPAWLTHRLDLYTQADINREVGEAAEWLDENIGPDPDRSYCYPCCHVSIGNPPDETAYRRAILQHHRFARAGSMPNEPKSARDGVNDPRQVDLLKIDGISYRSPRAAFFPPLLESALASGGWLALFFHGVGGPSHETPREIHRAIIRALKQARFWVAPVRDVARHIESTRKTSA